MSNRVIAQYDTIYTSKGSQAVIIKEILPDVVKFTYPDEELQNSVYKNTIFKIRHKSGRIEVFSETTAFNTITGAEDWEKVLTSKTENEVKGLFKIEDVTSKALGGTLYANTDKVKDRAYKKLKIEAAMMGANIIYLSDERMDFNRQGTVYQTGAITASLTGIAYTNIRPELEPFKAIVSSKKEFKLIKKQWLGRDNIDLKETDEFLQPTVKIEEIIPENGIIYVKAKIKDQPKDKYRVTYYDDQKIILMCRDAQRIYNFILVR